MAKFKYKPRPLTKTQVMNELIAIAKVGQTEPFIAGDLVFQEDLFRIQEKFIRLMDRIDRPRMLKTFPYLYRKLGI